MTDSIEDKPLLTMVVIVETLAIIFALTLAYFFKVNLLSQIVINLKNTIIAIEALVLLTAINFAAVFILPRYIPLFKGLRVAYDDVCHIVSKVSLPSVFIIAFLSGFAEELLFRGLVQQLTGIVIASIIFGLFHVGGKKTIIYGAYTVFIGFYLGYLLIYTDSLWPPILVHMINNALAIPLMKYNYKKLKLKEALQAEEAQV